MILGRICGKITTIQFEFEIENETKKFEFVQVLHRAYDYVLCQVVEIERAEKEIAKCLVIGYKDPEGRIRPIRIPFDMGAEVLRAEDDFIRKVLKQEIEKKGAYIGLLDGKDIRIELDLELLLTKHVAVLAKSGAGKSYTVGVLIEEIMERKVPVLIIDPHGEYSSLKQRNDEQKDALKAFGVKPASYTNIVEYGDPKLTPGLRPLKLNGNLTPYEIISLIPGKLSNTQLGILHNSIKHLNELTFTSVILALENEENNAKWTLINNLEYLNNMDIFTDSYVSYNEIVQGGRCSIINLKGVSPDVQEIIIYKLIKDLFELRKQGKIPPFFTVLEEAHNYCPERSFGETRCSKVLRTVASEGRKFGLGLCIVSQRPARVDKSILSQCTTQFIMKVTNPNDLKAISHSVEGITAESEEEIKNLPIGTAMITGIVDIPLFVNIRPRKTMHGGHAVNMLGSEADEKFLEKVGNFSAEELLPVIRPKTSVNDIKLMSEKEISMISVALVPAYLLSCSDKDLNFSVLVEMVNGEVVTDIETCATKSLPDFSKLSPKEIKLLQAGFKLGRFDEADLARAGQSLDNANSLNTLVSLGFIIKKDSKYSLSGKFIFSHLSKCACYEKIEYQKVDYSIKLTPKTDIDTVKDAVARYANVLDVKECYIVRYDITFKE